MILSEQLDDEPLGIMLMKDLKRVVVSTQEGTLGFYKWGVRSPPASLLATLWYASRAVHGCVATVRGLLGCGSWLAGWLPVHRAVNHKDVTTWS